LPLLLRIHASPWDPFLIFCFADAIAIPPQDIPTAYWRAVGDTRFDGNWYNLAGPLETVKVKSARYTSSKQTFCHFTKGWVDFVALNHLKMGDTLVFAEVSEAEFEVRKL
ncbi:hypothetical protein KC19_12G071900, partial [Ceratodon purpureus]